MSTLFINGGKTAQLKNMFFHDVLVKSEVIGPVWRAANSLSEGPDDNTNLPIICRKLGQWVGSESMDASRRLSLRTSAILIDGAAKLYKKEMEQLVEDVAKLDEEMIFRNSRNPMDFEDDPTISSSRSSDIPEKMMRAEIHPDVSFEAPTRNFSISPPTIHRDHSFISHTSTPSPSKRMRKEIIDTVTPIRFTNSDQSKETTPYPWSKSSDSDNTENFLKSSDKTDDDKSSDVTYTESDKSNSRSEKPQNSNNSNLLLKQRVLTSDGQNLTHSDQNNIQSEINSEISDLATERDEQNTDKRSQSSPTFTEIFDVAGQNEIASNIDAHNAKINTDSDIRKRNYDRDGQSSDVRTIVKSSDISIVKEKDSQTSHSRSIILKTTKKLRRKKASKPKKILKDQATQASLTSMRERDHNNYNDRLPFAYLLIHDSYQSRFPSKIVISSLNENINNLVCL